MSGLNRLTQGRGLDGKQKFVRSAIRETWKARNTHILERFENISRMHHSEETGRHNARHQIGKKSFVSQSRTSKIRVSESSKPTSIHRWTEVVAELLMDELSKIRIGKNDLNGLLRKVKKYPTSSIAHKWP